jgi:hypothetical protein
VLFMMPSRDISEDAKKARSNFARALSAYIELCALERNSGAGATVALANAAEVGDSWVFRKIGRSWPDPATTGIPPWDSLKVLSEDLGLPELAERRRHHAPGQRRKSSEVYRQLRARSASAAAPPC